MNGWQPLPNGLPKRHGESRPGGESAGRWMLQQFYPFRCTSSISMKAIAYSKAMPAPAA
jgi:hypothetical protein